MSEDGNGPARWLFALPDLPARDWLISVFGKRHVWLFVLAFVPGKRWLIVIVFFLLSVQLLKVVFLLDVWVAALSALSAILVFLLNVWVALVYVQFDLDVWVTALWAPFSTKIDRLFSPLLFFIRFT